MQNTKQIIVSNLFITVPGEHVQAWQEHPDQLHHPCSLQFSFSSTNFLLLHGLITVSLTESCYQSPICLYRSLNHAFSHR